MSKPKFPPYTLPHREWPKEHDLPEDHLNRQAFSKSGRDYSIWTTPLRIFGTKDRFWSWNMFPMYHQLVYDRWSRLISSLSVATRQECFNKCGGRRIFITGRAQTGLATLNFEAGISLVSLQVQYRGHGAICPGWGGELGRGLEYPLYYPDKFEERDGHRQIYHPDE